MTSDERGTPVTRRTGGRSARIKDAVLAATWDTLLDEGLEGLTFSEVGRRAGVHATSVQRRWGSRENLLFEALIRDPHETVVIPDTGSLRGDLHKLISTLAGYFATPMGASVQQMLVSNADKDPAFAARRSEFVNIRFEAMGAIIRRAAGRGELRAGVDEKTALDLMLGPLYFRLLIPRRPIDDPFIDKMIDTILRGLAA